MAATLEKTVSSELRCPIFSYIIQLSVNHVLDIDSFIKGLEYCVLLVGLRIGAYVLDYF